MLPHISVCIITFKRPRLLKKLLAELNRQATDGLFVYSIVVTDNDHEMTAKQTVTDFTTVSSIETKYCVEPTPSIPLARNKVVKNATGDYLAFIDDDEHPTERWLVHLFQAVLGHQADGVLGPVEPHFEVEVPDWVRKIRLFHHPHHPTGHVLNWDETRTGNVLLKKNLIDREHNLFDPKFATHGEDKDFFKRLISQGHKFIWCDEAVVYETQQPERLTKKYQLRRALLRGSIAYGHAPAKIKAVLTSVIAFGLYTPALPFLQLTGHHNFMKYLIKDCDHIGRILSCLGYKVEKHVKL